MKGPGNPLNVKNYIDMFRRSDVYRRALVSGMGYSSRAETEKYINLGKTFTGTGRSPANAFYKKSLRWMRENWEALIVAIQVLCRDDRVVCIKRRPG